MSCRLTCAGLLVVLALLGPGAASAQPVGCSGDRIEEQLVAWGSQLPDPAAFVYTWERLAVRAQVAEVPQPEVWELFCGVFTAAWDAGAGQDGQLASQAAAATAVAARWPQLPPLIPSPEAPSTGGRSPGSPTDSVVGERFLVDASAVTPTSVTLSWAAAPRADAYEVVLSSPQGVRLASRRVYATGGGSASNVTTTISGLTPGYTYRFDVSALRVAGQQSAVEVARSITVSASTPLPVVPTPTPFTTPGPERTRPNAP
jgi:Fibronectin type III domain